MTDKRQEQKNESQNRIAAEKRDVGDLPPMPVGEAAELRRRCFESLQFFLEYCFASVFYLAWSDDHLRVIREIERIGRGEGGSLLKAIAMSRGSGKSTLLTCAVIWLILTRHRRFAVIVAATAKKAKELLAGIKTQLLHNERLHQLFPQELYAVRCLKGEGKKAAHQTSNGVLVGALWSTDTINLGSIRGCPIQGAGISAVGLTSGNIRGQQLTIREDGELKVIRPDLVIPDDPQTRKSSKSPSQSLERWNLLVGDCLGMAGPGKRIAALCACTVVHDGDLSSRLLDRDQSPEWQGELCKMVYQWPDNEDLWEEYRDIKHAELRSGGDGSLANQFVRDNYEELHRGSKVGWEERTGGGEEGDVSAAECISALQYAYDLRFTDEETFFAEYQNEPLTSVQEKRFDLLADEIAQRVGADPKDVVPAGCEKITCGIDVQKELLFFVVVAWTATGRGHVISYGAWPDQNRRYFGKRNLHRSLQRESGSEMLDESIYNGLEALSQELLGRTYERADGAQMQIDRVGVDARWGNSTRIVRRFCRETQYAGRIMPMMGQYIGAKNRPWDFWTHSKTHRLGVHCRIQPPPPREPGSREILIDSNWWRSWVAERLSVGKGSDRALLLYKATPSHHRLISEHLTAEEAIQTEGPNGRVVTEWKEKPSVIGNDMWDCLVMASVLAHVEGIPVEDGATKDSQSKQNNRSKKRKRRKVSPLAC